MDAGCGYYKWPWHYLVVLGKEGLKSKFPRLCDLHKACSHQGFGSGSWDIGSEVMGLAGHRVPLHAWPCRNHIRPWVGEGLHLGAARHLDFLFVVRE